MIQRFLSILIMAVICALGSGVAPASIASAAEAGPGEGLVVFSRKKSSKGMAIQFNIRQDGRPIGQLRSGTTLKIPLAPGSYNFTVRSVSLDGEDFLTINVQAGWTYFVEGKILWGWPTGRPKFQLTSHTPGPKTASAHPVASQTRPEPVAVPVPMAGPALGDIEPQAAASPRGGPTANDRGRISLRNFRGDWSLDMWSMATDFSKLKGRGAATGTAMGDGATQIIITEFASVAFPEATGGGRLLIAHVPDRGFTLESEFKYSGELLKFSGQYDEVTGRYIFYLSDSTGGETATGMPRTSVRVEIRSLDLDSWVAETYSAMDGQSIKVQSYRFTRR